MVRIAEKTAALQHGLSLALQTTQLIFTRNEPIDITFRSDERRFDVEGPNNIRYELIKKRIDKIKLRSSMERLTQPGKIAIVVSRMDEIEEYFHYVRLLQKEGLFSENVELLNLEDLQDVHALKAIRVQMTGL